MNPNVRPGDIILFHYRAERGFWGSPLSWAITKVQGHQTTHSGIIVDPYNELVVDAFWPCIRVIKLSDMFDPKNYKWEIRRVNNASARQSFLAASNAINYIGSKYDLKSWISLATAMFIERFTKAPIRDRYDIKENPKKLFCQELVTQCYIDAGFDFAGMMGFKDPSAILPKDIHENKVLFKFITKSE
jgi:hypothetical protein